VDTKKKKWQHHCLLFFIYLLWLLLLLLLLLIVLDLVESGLGVKQPFSPFVFFLLPLGDRDRPYDKRVVDERR
jgi:hypothetical protein